MRIRGLKWTEREFSESGIIIKTPGEYKGRWNGLFGRNGDIFLEIGCGKGSFICESAAENPDINYIGVEKIWKILSVASKKARDAELSNVLLMNIDAGNLNEIFAPGEISRIYLNFSDPWIKKSKRIKRRLTHGNFLEIYKNILRPSGSVYFKTDNEDFFDFSAAEFEKHGWTLEFSTRDLYKSRTKGIMTEYEKRFVSMGLPIFMLKAAFSEMFGKK